MEYYIGKYWEMMNSHDPDVRAKGIVAWDETAKKYGPYYESIKGHLPKKFLKIFEKESWFHDFAINNINIENKGKSVSVVTLQISHDDEVYKITLTGVKGLSIEVPHTHYWLCGNLTWGYVEFELNDDKSWIIRVLCDMNCEIQILFKRISITKTQ